MGRDTEHVDMAAICPILTFPPAWRLRLSSSPSVKEACFVLCERVGYGRLYALSLLPVCIRTAFLVPWC